MKNSIQLVFNWNIVIFDVFFRVFLLSNVQLCAGVYPQPKKLGNTNLLVKNSVENNTQPHR